MSNVDECYKSLLDGSLDTSQLGSLPNEVLVQIVERAVSERLAADEQLPQVEAELKAIRSSRYVVDPPGYGPRLGDEDYDRAAQITVKWTENDTSSAEFPISNLERHLAWADGSLRLVTTQQLSDGSYKQLHEVISALLVYRVCCLFAISVDVQRPAGHKAVWSTADLVHNATGASAIFTEWERCPQIRVSTLDLPKQFEENLLELLNLLCDPENCPHPYDGTVAGSHA